MANSKYEYVKAFEQPDHLLPNTFIVVRIDGRGFHKFCDKYEFTKPNDRAAIDLMNEAAKNVMRELPDITIAYGISDEFSFVFHRSCTLFERRASKIVTTVTSTFTAYYVHLWSNYFPNKLLTAPLPSFDGRAVCYPSESNLRDYMSWRQVDCHINNLYNTTFWTLVLKGGLSNKEAEAKLSGTLASDKNEILFSQFGINYNNEPDIYKKGSILYRDYALRHPRPQPAPPNPLSPPIPKTIPIRSSTAQPDPALRAPATVVHAPILLSRKENESGQVEKRSKTLEEKIRKRRGKADVIVYSGDMVKDEFWNMRPWILEGGVGGQKEAEGKPEN